MIPLTSKQLNIKNECLKTLRKKVPIQVRWAVSKVIGVNPGTSPELLAELRQLPWPIPAIATGDLLGQRLP